MTALARWEGSSTIAFDAALVGWLSHCTVCGAPVIPLWTIWGTRIYLLRLAIAVFAVACDPCQKAWLALLPGLVERLEKRYEHADYEYPHAAELARAQL